ncbi:glycosyltransferase family 4 protein [uncultured Planktosalinus sp.]|uniref:glycosyltransferase family 4 protein n=1 Tax=uncultured Planktosalinus sp. TaxID=1810935 RepID=UPI0030DCA5D7
MKMSKTIAFIGPLPPPVGGVALANIRVQHIVKQNHPNYTILNYNTSKGGDRADLYKKKGLKELSHFLSNIFGVLKFIAKNKIDVSNIFVVPNISFIREALLILFLKTTTKKLVIHLHAKTEGDFFLNGIKLKLFTKILSLGDVIFVLSENYHKKFYAQYIKPEKLVVLENFIDYKEFENDIEQKSNDFLYVGRLSEKKGFYTLVKALALHKNEFKSLKIHVLGEFENETFEQKIISLIEKHSIENFIFYGSKTGYEKNELFKKCAVFIFPSYFENSPIVLKEAIAAKMAIISSDIQENKNILDPFDNKLFFETKNENDLAAKMKVLIESPQKVKKMMTASEHIKDFNFETASEIIEKYLY